MTDHPAQQSMPRATLLLLQRSLAHVSGPAAKLSTGKAFVRPSDDPPAALDAIRIRAEQRVNARYAQNAADGLRWLRAIDVALTTSMALLRRARDVTVEGANTGTLGEAGRRSLATELEATAEALRAQANTAHDGRWVFAGTSDAVATFDAFGGYHGVHGAAVERRVGATTTVRIDSDGPAVFGDGEDSVFALLRRIAGDLRAGRDVIVHLDEIDARLNGLLEEIAGAGSRYDRLLAAAETIAAHAVTLSSRLIEVEDVNVAATIVELRLQEVALGASLSANRRAVQPALLDFVR